MAGDDWYKPHPRPAPPRQPTPGERVWSLIKNGRQVDCELRFHRKAYGWECQFLLDGELAEGRRFTLRELALQEGDVPPPPLLAMSGIFRRERSTEADTYWRRAGCIRDASHAAQGCPSVGVAGLLARSRTNRTTSHSSIGLETHPCPSLGHLDWGKSTLAGWRSPWRPRRCARIR
jgi:hypothetical protein